jgi:hypothetical protein
MKRLVMFVFLVAVMFGARATTDSNNWPKGLEDELLRNFPDYSIGEISEGDLFGSSEHDVVACVSRQKNVFNQSYRVVVLRFISNGTFKVMESSPEFEVSSRSEISLSIKKRSLFIQTATPNYVIANIDTEQYQYRGGHFYLVGLEFWSFGHSENTQDYEYRISTNLLTGNKIDTASNVFKGKRMQRTLKYKVPTHALRRFDQDQDNKYAQIAERDVEQGIKETWLRAE